MNNSQLKTLIKTNTIALEALKKEAINLEADIAKTEKDIQARFTKLVLGFDKHAPFIPEKMRQSIQFHISSSKITPKWNDYSREGYMNTLDIYYYGPKNWENERAEGNSQWQFSHHSGKFSIHTTEAGWKTVDNEYLDYMKLSLGLYHFVNSCKDKIEALHKEYYKNESRIYDTQSAFRQLDQAIRDAETQIERNNIIVHFKPAGETAAWLLNKEIDLPIEISWSFSRRNNPYFSAIKLIKENKKNGGVKVELIRKYKNDQGEVQSWVSETKTLQLNTLIEMYKHSLRMLEKQKEREERERKRQEELSKQVA